jgi:hypothetical protein
MSRLLRTRLVGALLAAALLGGVACSSTPSDASISAGLTADVSLIQAAIASGDRRTALDLLHRLDSFVDGLLQMGAMDPSRVEEIHAAVADVLATLRAARSAPAVTPSPVVTTTTPPPPLPPPGHADGKDHGPDKPPKGHDKPPKD